MTEAVTGTILFNKTLSDLSNIIQSSKMNTFKTILAALLLVPAVSMNAASGCSALSGEYHIGGSDADYPTISAAISALHCGGVNGPVTFLIADGRYAEKVELGDIFGISAQNSITFESEKGNSADVVLVSPTPDAEYTLHLSSATNFAFTNLTIDNATGFTGNAVKIDGASRNIKFRNVVFNGTERQSNGANNAVIYSTANGAKTNISFEDCEINNGSVGIYKGGAATADSRTTVQGTLFFNQYESALKLNNEAAPVLSNNVISSISTSKDYKGIALEHATGNMVISNNVINSVNGTYGIALNNCEGTSENYGSIANNSVNVGGEGAMYGLYLTGSTDNIVFNFNRVKLATVKDNKFAQAYYTNKATGSNINVMNNIFYDLSTGGYTVLGNTYKDFYNQLPAQSNASLTVSANGIMIEKVTPAN